MKNLIILVLLATLCSCSSTQTAFDSSPVNSKSVDLDPIKADINIDESSKIKGSSKSTYFLFVKWQPIISSSIRFSQFWISEN